MKIGQVFIVLWIILNLATVCVSNSDDEEEKSGDENHELPAHEFKYKERIGKKGKNAGQKKETVTLVIPPWVFTRKRDATEDNDIAYFRCNSCRPKDCIAQAER